MATPRPIGKGASSTRLRLLDAVEALMIEAGHAAVTYRAVAERAGVVPSNVQYYFPTLEDLLVATVRRRTEQSLAHLLDLLQSRPDQPLRALWEFSADETTAALAFEFSALGNQLASVRTETSRYMNRLRGIQLGTLVGAGLLGDDEVPTPAVLFLLSGIPKLIQMEQSFEIDVGHREIIAMVEELLDAREPTDGDRP